EKRYRAAAVNAAEFLLQHLKDEKGLLSHRWCEGEVAVPGFAEDYVFFALGLLDLYEATFEPRYLREALFLSRELIRLFWDEKAGGLFSAGKENEELLLRMKEIYDGALPSANAVAVLLFLEIGHLTMDREFEEKARRILLAFSDAILRFPAGCPQVLSGIDFTLGPSHEITIAAHPGHAVLDDWMREIYRSFLPNKVVALHPAGSAGAEEIENLVPFLKNQSMIENRPTVYVCENNACRTPVTEIGRLKNILNTEG
ncbi:MAG: thioredoxin domain-containing protein, partial [Candidatus Omnitrophica bacterium]|nr:thioredoxin domain-containing protein [Candidatus Omnitrophota bacterium]